MEHELYKTCQLIRRNPLVQISLVIIVVIIALALTAPILPIQDPTEQDLMAALVPPSFAGGTSAHLLGTDYLGRDILSRIIWGSRISLLVGFSVVVIAFLVGVTAGLVATYHGGVTEEIVMRIVDVVLSVPQVLIAIAVLAIFG